nr:baseplate J/gp47 family protein [Chloroflexota bacterium]
AAYALLPSATVVIVPRTEPVAPLSFAVTADPAATATDSAAGIVPAERIELAVETSDTFEATGKRVVETKAKGTVTFQSFDPGGPNTIPARSVIATEGGIQFRTTRSITLPAAQIVPEGNGAVIIPTRADVSVVAVKAGEAGNVPSNAITLVPRGENPTLTKVRNADPTEGGSRQEFPKVVQADIDAALTALQTALSEEFAARLADPSIAPAGTTLFAATAALGPTTTTVDPATFLDQEIATFELGLSAIGTVVAADPAPVTAIAEERLLGSVSAGRELVAGSVRIEVGEGSVSGGEVRFPVTASAMQVGTLDPVALEALILGKPVDEARRLLAGFGDVELTVWPDWVTTVPTLEARVEVRTERPIEVTTTTPSPAP